MSEAVKATFVGASVIGIAMIICTFIVTASVEKLASKGAAAAREQQAYIEGRLAKEKDDLRMLLIKEKDDARQLLIKQKDDLKQALIDNKDNMKEVVSKAR